MKLEAAFLAATVILFFSCSILYAGQRGDEKVIVEREGDRPLNFPAGTDPLNFVMGLSP